MKLRISWLSLWEDGWLISQWAGVNMNLDVRGKDSVLGNMRMSTAFYLDKQGELGVHQYTIRCKMNKNDVRLNVMEYENEN